jgi:hypothetical protein
MTEFSKHGVAENAFAIFDYGLSGDAGIAAGAECFAAFDEYGGS